MSPSARYSASPIDECKYEPLTGPHDPHTIGGHTVPEYRVHVLEFLTGARPPQSHAYPNRRLSDTIINVQTGGFFDDGWHCAPIDWVHDLSVHAYQLLGSYPIKQSEYTVDTQGGFDDYPCINNTLPYYDLEKHHIDAYLGLLQVPPDYNESIVGCNLPLYDDTDGYYERQSASHCLYPHPEQLISDNQHSTSNSLQDHEPSLPNHVHVPPGMHIDISTADSHGQHVGTSISLNLTMDRDCMMLDPSEYQSGCVGLPQLVFHAERPPISSYSELSAHMSALNASSRQSKTSGSVTASPSVSVSAPALATASTVMVTATSAAQDSSKPLKCHDAGSDWKLAPRSASSDKEARPSQKRNTPPPSKTAPLPFEAWPPLQSQSQRKAGDRVLVKYEEQSSPPPPYSQRKQQLSPNSSRRSSLNKLHRSRTLSPSSRSQGILKTIMMKRGGQKKQDLACLFCRERKIACGRPAEGSLDPCNQCSRRSLVCQYPIESRRGQHKRNAKKRIKSRHDVHRAKY